MSKEHMNYLRRKTADEAELWAADRIEELELSRAGCSQQLKDACADLSEVERERDALQADNARLREFLGLVVKGEHWAAPRTIQKMAEKELAATPTQSLARLRNEVLEKAAKRFDDDDADLYDLEFHAAAIRAMKEPE